MSDEEWELVANPARAKREARKERRGQRGEEQDTGRYNDLAAEDIAREMYSVRKSAVAKSSSSSQAEVPRVATQTMASRRAAKNARRGKSKSSSKSVKLPENETDLIECIHKLLVLESRSLTIAELGARVQTSMRTSWNKAFKSTYGAMDKFLKNHLEVFHVTKDRGEIFVSLRKGTIKKKKDSDASPSSPARSSGASKLRVSFVNSPLEKNGVSKPPSKFMPTAKNLAASGNSKSSKASKKSKRNRKSASSSESSPSGSLFTLLLILVTLFVSGVAFLRYQDEELYLSYQDKTVEFIKRALKDYM